VEEEFGAVSLNVEEVRFLDRDFAGESLSVISKADKQP
jgi:hypothetical protein